MQCLASTNAHRMQTQTREHGPKIFKVVRVTEYMLELLFGQFCCCAWLKTSGAARCFVQLQCKIALEGF